MHSIKSNIGIAGRSNDVKWPEGVIVEGLYLNGPKNGDVNVVVMKCHIIFYILLNSQNSCFSVHKVVFALGEKFLGNISPWARVKVETSVPSDVRSLSAACTSALLSIFVPLLQPMLGDETYCK